MTTVNAATIRRLLCGAHLGEARLDPAAIREIKSEKARTFVWLSWTTDPDLADVATLLRRGWTDGAWRVRVLGSYVAIERRGDADVGPLPPVPAEFPGDEQTWSLFVLAALHDRDALDLSRHPFDALRPLFDAGLADWEAPPVGVFRSGVRRIALTSAGRDLVTTAVRSRQEA